MIAMNKQTTPVQPLALRLKDAGRAMSLSDRTVWELLKSGRLRGLRVGVKWIVPVDEIRAFLQREAGPAPGEEKGKLSVATGGEQG